MGLRESLYPGWPDKVGRDNKKNQREDQEDREDVVVFTQLTCSCPTALASASPVSQVLPVTPDLPHF